MKVAVAGALWRPGRLTEPAAVPSIKNWTVPVGMVAVEPDTVTLSGMLPETAQRALVVVTETLDKAVAIVLPPPAAGAFFQSLIRFETSILPRPVARS